MAEKWERKGKTMKESRRRDQERISHKKNRAICQSRAHVTMFRQIHNFL